jgi:acyl transferase domain-containing protein
VNITHFIHLKPRPSISVLSAGLFMAAQSLFHNASPAILNLRTLNPYVATAVADWQKVAAPKATMARQFGPSASEQPGSHRAAGASSFGMSGVNAHVLVVGGSSQEAELLQKPWQRAK